jgi:hypothetical protein
MVKELNTSFFRKKTRIASRIIGKPAWLAFFRVNARIPEIPKKNRAIMGNSPVKASIAFKEIVRVPKSRYEIATTIEERVIMMM